MSESHELYGFFVPRKIKSPRTINHTNEKHGRLMVLGYLGKPNHESKHSLWLCRCECGELCPYEGRQINRKKYPVKECVKCSRAGRVKHNASSEPWYDRYRTMITRCKPVCEGGKEDWGGRGIKVCQEWIDDPWQYFRDVGNPPEDGYTLDRIDNNGNYELSNVRWADRQIQIHNSRIAKLNREVVREGRRRVARGETVQNVRRSLAPLVHPNTFYYAMIGKTWKEKQGPQTRALP